VTKLLPLALLFACTGCGTVCNLVVPGREDKVYGGVRFDVEQIQKLVEGAPASDGVLSPGAGNLGGLLAAAFVLGPFLDLPLSAVGDTVTLPITRWLDDRK
jgi:uncharacterized protein YceK